MMAYLFPTLAECEAKLVILDGAMRQAASSRGFTVTPEGVVGKNALTGQDNLGSVTTKWSDPILMDDGQYGIPSIRDRMPTSHLLVEQACGLSEPVVSSPYTPPEEQ